MGTRCGATDSRLILHLLTECQLDAAGLKDLIYHKSGLLGGLRHFFRYADLRTSSDPRAREAIDLFVYRIVKRKSGRWWPPWEASWYRLRWGDWAKMTLDPGRSHRGMQMDRRCPGL